MRTELRGLLRVVGVAAAGAGIVAGGTWLDGGVDVTRAGDAPAPGSASVRSLTSEWACPGPVDDGADTTPTSTTPTGATSTRAVPTTPVSLFAATWPTADATPGTLTARRLPGLAKLDGLPQRPASVGSTRLPPGSAAVVSGSGSPATGTAVEQFAIDTAPGRRGMQLTACAPPTSDSWLLAGGSGAGRLVHLVLVNPADAPVTVDLQVLGSHGPVDPVSRQGVVVPSHARKVVALDTSNADVEDLVVHVMAHDGSVAAWALDTWYAGETAIGTALTGPAAAPDGTQVLPGVDVPAGTNPRVRIAVPGTADSVVRVRAVDAQGNTRFDDTTTVVGGAAGHLDLTGLPAGIYSVLVSADAPVVAAVIGRSAPAGITDIAWTPAATPVTGTLGAAVPPGQHASLVLFPTQKSTLVHVNSVTRSLPAGRPTIIDVSTNRSMFVDVRRGAVAAALLLSGKDKDGGFLAATSLAPLPTRADVTDVAAADR